MDNLTNGQRWYREQLKSPEWQKKRLKIFERDDFTCRHCQAKDQTLHIHHFKYDGRPWEVEDEYLITLCWECHELESRVYKSELDDVIRSIRDKWYSSEALFKLNWFLSWLDADSPTGYAALIEMQFKLTDEEKLELYHNLKTRVERGNKIY